jgi:hypothetical protein
VDCTEDRRSVGGHGDQYVRQCRKAKAAYAPSQLIRVTLEKCSVVFLEEDYDFSWSVLGQRFGAGLFS